MKPHEPCKSRGDCYHIRAGRKGGRKGGRKLVESGQADKNLRKAHAVLDANPEILRGAGRKLGRKAVESGHLQRIAVLGGRKVAESGQLAEARKRANAVLAAKPEILRENGRKVGLAYGYISGRKAVESGQIQALGRIQGRKNVESGQLARIVSLGGRKAVESGHLQRISSLGGRKGGRKAVESGHLAHISGGVPSTADGILFRSQTEAMFYCVAKELGGEPVYEPGFIKLPDGTSYMPDFVLDNSVLDLPAGVPIELKPAHNAYYSGNVEKAIRAGATVIYWDELVEPESAIRAQGLNTAKTCEGQ